MKIISVIVTLAVLALVANAQLRGLVVLDDLSAQGSFSTFTNSLQSKGYTLTFKEATDPTLEITRYGVYSWDFIVLLCPHTETFGGTVDVDAILNFVDDGHSLIIAADPLLSDTIREIATECGVTFSPDKSYVIDHHGHHSSLDSGDHTLILADDFNTNPLLFGKLSGKPVLYRGIGQTLEEGNNLIAPLLRASRSAYSAIPDQESSEDEHVNHRPILVSALQARNSARVLISGSVEMFGDRFIKNGDGNKEFIEQVTGWILKERGVLRASNVTHHLVGETQPRDIYKITDNLTYSVVIEEFDGKNWVPFTNVQEHPVQLEFTMLDPYVRKNLTFNPSTGVFSTTFTIPDVYGIFTLRLRYEREGFSNILEERIVTVRPFKHNEYERFIVAAYPYYASSFSMLAGLFVFSIFFLFTREKRASRINQ